jgi:hypothetical protein
VNTGKIGYFAISLPNQLESIMSKERKSNKEVKKQPLLNPKEKKAAKKERKEANER